MNESAPASDAPSPYAEWLGKTELWCDTVQLSPQERLDATFDREPRLLSPGDPLPHLSHWLHFLPNARASEIGADGHPKRGGFLPAVDHLPRRMWAGGRLTFEAPLIVGAAVSKRSTIADIRERESRNGPLVFVTVVHEIFAGDTDGPLLVREEQDIVYRGLTTAPPREERRERGTWQRQVLPDEVLLFRYSALTFNGHRIHYDAPYVTEVEGYPGLIVHGPMLATLLLDLAERSAPERTVKTLSYRGVAPFFVGREITFNGEPDGDAAELWAERDDGTVGMVASVTFAPEGNA